METKEAKEFNIADFIYLIRQKKKFIIFFIIIFSALTLVYSYIIPHKYTATASILPPEEDAAGGGLSNFLQTLSGGFSFGGLSKGLKIELYLEMMTSKTAAKYIVDKCNLRKYKEFQFENDEILYDVVSSLLYVEANRSGLMLVSATIATPYFPNSKDKQFAAELSAKIANAAVESLNFINKKKSNLKAIMKKDFISKVLQRNKKLLDSIDKDLETFQKQNKLIAIDEQTTAMLENIVNLGIALSKAEVEYSLAKQEFESGSPILKAFEEKLSSLREQYQRAQEGGIIPKDKFSIPFEHVPSLIRKYTNLIRDQKILTQVILYLETQKYQEEIQSESDIPTVFALDEAKPPYKKSSPSRLIMLILGIILSTFISVSYVVYQAFRKGEYYIKQSHIK